MRLKNFLLRCVLPYLLCANVGIGFAPVRPRGNRPRETRGCGTRESAPRPPQGLDRIHVINIDWVHRCYSRAMYACSTPNFPCTNRRKRVYACKKKTYLRQIDSLSVESLLYAAMRHKMRYGASTARRHLQCSYPVPLEHPGVLEVAILVHKATLCLLHHVVHVLLQLLLELRLF